MSRTPLRALARLFLTLALLAQAPAQAASSGIDTDFAEWQKWARHYQATDLRTADGQLLMGQLDDQFWHIYYPAGMTDAHFKEALAVTSRWTVESPAAPLAHILHARVLFMYAVYFRGMRRAPSSPPHALENFRKYALDAARYLAEHRKVAATDTTWHVDMLWLAKFLDWPVSQARAIADEGIALKPGDDRIYRAMTWYLLWHGNRSELDEFINGAAKARGMALYAHLYGVASADVFKHRLFNDSPAEWSKMKQGLEDNRARYPGSLNTNLFAYYACIAGDKETTRTLLAEIGSDARPDAWAPNGAQTLAGCRRWAAEP